MNKMELLALLEAKFPKTHLMIQEEVNLYDHYAPGDPERIVTEYAAYIPVEPKLFQHSWSPRFRSLESLAEHIESKAGSFLPEGFDNFMIA